MNRSFRIDDNVYKKLNSAAQQQDRSVNWLVNQALKEFLDKEALDEKMWQETLEAIDSANRGEVISSDKVHEWIESWGNENELSPPQDA